jgi:selenocysteine lyase/cysteine desulfurase
MRNDEIHLRHDAAARAELGCPHFAGMFALGASVEFLTEIGAGNIQERVLGLNRYLTERAFEWGVKVLSPLEEESARSAETLLAVAEPARVVAQLAERGVTVTEKPQGIRVATDFFNNEADVDRLIAALRETIG